MIHPKMKNSQKCFFLFYFKPKTSPLPILLSPGKKSSHLNQKYAQIKHCLQAKTVLNDYGLNDGFISYKHAAFSLHRMLIDALDSCGLLVDHCEVFISCLDSHSDGTHSSQRIQWGVNDVMLNFSKSVLMKKQTHLNLGWPERENNYFCE